MKQLLLSVSIILLFAFTITARAQDGANAKALRLQYSNYTGAGILLGQSDPHLAVQTVNGVQYGLWFAGVGVGLDYYYQRSVPLFIDLRRQVLPNKNWYVYGDAGVNYPYLKKESEENMWYQSDHKQGLYLDGGVGYLFSADKQTGFFSIGYSSKKLRETIAYPYIWGPPNMNVPKENLRYQFNRIVVKAGLRF